MKPIFITCYYDIQQETRKRSQYIDRFYKIYEYISTFYNDFHVYIFTTQTIYNEIILHKQFNNFLYRFEFIIRDVKSLPGRDYCDCDCPPYKLDPKLPHNRKLSNIDNLLNKLNTIYLNKFYLINEIYTYKNITSCIWLDFGFSDKLSRLPMEKMCMDFQPGKLYTRRYGSGEVVKGHGRGGLMKMRPYRLLHNECNIPHFIRAGVMGIHRDGFNDIYDIYNTELKSVTKDNICFDEETVLSYIFLKHPEVFSRWSSLPHI